MARIATTVALAGALGGCVAAAIPVVASSAIVRSRMEQKRDARAAQAAPPATDAGRSAAPAGTVRVIEGLTELPRPAGAPPPQRRPAPSPAQVGAAVPETMQYLYGSGEGAALSVQAYAALTGYLRLQATAGRAGQLRQVVLSDGASLNAPQFEPCGGKPLAAVFDVDETVLLNLGYEEDAARRGQAFDEGRWSRWEASGADKVVAVPGAHRAIAAARADGITIIFNSNRTREHAAATTAALEGAGLGPAKHGTTLWLKGDDGGGSGKDDRRWAIASGYCVIALVGDQLGDFSDLFNDPALTPSTRRALAASPALAPLWGAGWFLLPNPVYGSALKGGFDDIFPVTTRWIDPGPAAPATAAANSTEASRAAPATAEPPK